MEKKQSSVEWLYSNNETICEMLLLDKIPKSTYEQLINCFSMNLEQAKAMHNKEIVDAHVNGNKEYTIGGGYELIAEHYYNETFGGQDNE